LELLKQSQQFLNERATADLSSGLTIHQQHLPQGNFRRKNRPMTTKNQRSVDPKMSQSFHVSGTSYHSSKLADILRQ
jgi:hypothetical protein